MWIFDVGQETLIVCRDPEGSSYRYESLVDKSGSASPLALPDVRIALSKIYL